MSSSYVPPLALLAAVAALSLATSCGQLARSESKPRPAVERVAVLAFDNQSSDDAGARVGEQVAQLVPLALAGSRDVYAFTAAGRAAAPLRRASQLVTGYLTREGGRWAIHAQIRDMAAPRALRAFTVGGGTAGELADAVAAQLGTPGFRFAGQDIPAIESALAGKSTPEALAALRLSPGAQALLAPLPAGNLAERAALLNKQSQLLPADSETAYVAGLALMQTRRFPDAAGTFRRAYRADPAWADLYNQAAFAEAFSGNQAEALAAIETYRKMDPTPNSLDSLGEVQCLFGHFGEAERAFIQAFDKDANFYGGVTLRKAAEARRLAGDPVEAAKLFDRYAAAHAKQPLIGLERAQWDFAAGRVKEGLAAAESIAAQSGASLAWTQVAAWRAHLGGDAAGAARQALAAARTAAEQQAAVVAIFASQPDVSASEWRARALKQFPPNAAPIARYALIHALALRKHWAEAVPLIEEARLGVHPAQAGHWQSLLTVALHESGQRERAKAEARLRPIPRTVGEATWEFLVYPRIVELIKTGS